MFFISFCPSHDFAFVSNNDGCLGGFTYSPLSQDFENSTSPKLKVLYILCRLPNIMEKFNLVKNSRQDIELVFIAT